MTTNCETISDLHHFLKQKLESLNNVINVSQSLTAMSDIYHNIEQLESFIKIRQSSMDIIDGIDQRIDVSRKNFLSALSVASCEEKDSINAIMDTITKKTLAAIQMSHTIEEKIKSSQNGLRNQMLNIINSHKALNDRSKHVSIHIKAKFLDVIS